MKFSSFNIPKEFVDALAKNGYIDMTPIQEESIPSALKGNSLICKSETGSGKTHAFLIPLICGLDLAKNVVQKLILVPTLELASQCLSFLKKLEKDYPYFTSFAFSSSTDSNSDIGHMKNASKPMIIISTPGKAKEIFLKKKFMSFTRISTLVLDEADMLLEKTYSETVLELYQKLHPRQILIYTATMKEHEISSIKSSLKISKVIETKNILSSSTIVHQLVNIRHLTKEEALVKYLNFVHPYFALVFCSSKKEIESVNEYLNNEGIPTLLITGQIDARRRNMILKRIALEEHPLILASDVASRGIDFLDVSHVISLDLPKDLDYYYHRAGRTGRNGKKGISVIFIRNEDERIKKLAKKITFVPYVLKNDSLNIIKVHVKPQAKKNENLHKEIISRLRKIKSKSIPGRKKRREVAIIKAKKAHKKKIIRENIKAKKSKK